MENRNRAPASPCARSDPRTSGTFHFLFSIFFCGLLLSGCASPGEPIERKPPVPGAVIDLTAAQSGDEVILTFTLPKETVDHQMLKETPTIEIYRDFEPTANPNGARSPAAPVNPSLLVTIPPGMAAQYVEKGQIRYADKLTGEDFTRHPDNLGIFIVRTRASVKKESANSNVVAVPIHPPLDPIGDLKAEIAHSAVVLAWSPPQKTVIGTAPPVVVYHIYRAPSEAGSLKSPLAKIGDTETTTFEDTQAELNQTYAYSVRSVAEYPGAALESADSNLAGVMVRDLTPPAAPLGLVVVCAPAQGDTPAHAELSWDISPETDIAGYNVYRSEDAGVSGTRMNATLLLTPTFRDMNTISGKRYFYSVTAADRSGNESTASAVVPCGAPGESQPTP